MDYRAEIVNLSKQFSQLRFGQYILSACKYENRDAYLLGYLSDEDLYERCKEYNKKTKSKN